MKTGFAAIILMAGMYSFAGQENAGIGISAYNPKEIYQALKVKEVNVNAGIAGVGRIRKSVGGLSCFREQLVVPNSVATYTCVVNQKKENFAAIYKALNVPEVDLNPGTAGSGHLQKSVGGLTCEKMTVVTMPPQTSYDCQISE